MNVDPENIFSFKFLFLIISFIYFVSSHVDNHCFREADVV